MTFHLMAALLTLTLLWTLCICLCAFLTASADVSVLRARPLRHQPLFTSSSDASLDAFVRVKQVSELLTSSLTPLLQATPELLAAALSLPFEELNRSMSMSTVFTSLIQSALTRLLSWSEAMQRHHSLQNANLPPEMAQAYAQQRREAEKFPYWRFVPAYQASALLSGSSNAWSSHCFNENTAILHEAVDGGFNVIMNHNHAKSDFCTENYLLGTVFGIQLHTVSCVFAPLCSQSETLLLNLSNKLTSAELFDVRNKGARIFLFEDDSIQTLTDLHSTLSLFAPITTQSVDSESATLNVDFLSKYADYKTLPRNFTSVPIDENLINSGDFFGVMRLDGLDPMLGWAMGAHIGHTVVALRFNSELFIIESTTKSSYWPTGGIQRTKYSDWIKQARLSDYNVVWAPLSAHSAAKFNTTAAINYFLSVEHIDYGLNTLLFSWLDTDFNNYPCLPPDFKLCLTPSHVQLLFGWFERAIPNIAVVLFSQAYNKRLNVYNNTFAELLQIANETGIPAQSISSIVERDSWLYNTTRFGKPFEGPSLVCCTFVCEIWRHAGLFGDLDFECSEQTNLDVYSLNMLAVPASLPSQCLSADPDAVLCQLEGKYTVDLGPVYASRAPYSHMGDHCPSVPPKYIRPSDC